MIERVYLTGFMTSGKSTIGPILANVLGWEFFDLDKVIEKEHERSVVEIFEEFGEEYFRNFETETLEKLCKHHDTIISLGGGTLSSEKNLSILKATGKIVYLRISAETIYQRLKHKIDRPLIRDLVLNERPKEEFIQRINKILDQRKKYYEKADIILDTDDNRIGITVDLLAAEMRRLMNARD